MARYDRSLVHPMSTELVAAEDVGVDPKRLDLFLARVRLEVEHGPLPSAQVAVARQGRLVAFETYGDATNGHRYILQSVGRNVVAAATWKLLGDGALGLGERVADVIPEFGTNGKDVVTVEQVLTHSGGFPFAPLGYPKMLDRESRLEAFARWRLDWEPGSRLQFHLTSAAWVIAELVERRTGQGLCRVPADGDRRASRPGVRPAAARRSLPRGPGGARRHRPDERRPGGGPMGPVVPGQPRGPGRRRAQPLHRGISRGPRPAGPGPLSFRTVGRGHGGRRHPDPALRSAVRRSDLWREPRDGQHRPLLHGQRRVRREQLHAAYRFARTFGHRGAPAQLAFTDAETGTSFAFLTNGYPLAGYDYSVRGVNLVVNIGNLGNDLIA